MAPKFGLSPNHNPEMIRDLIRLYLTLLQKHHVDFTGSFAALSQALTQEGGHGALQEMFANDPEFDTWHGQWMALVAGSAGVKESALDRMASANPIYIPRNHLVEEAIEVATSKGDFSFMEKLLEAVSSPYEAKPGFGRYALPPKPDEEVHRTFCGT